MHILKLKTFKLVAISLGLFVFVPSVFAQTETSVTVLNGEEQAIARQMGFACSTKQECANEFNKNFQTNVKKANGLGIYKKPEEKQLAVAILKKDAEALTKAIEQGDDIEAITLAVKQLLANPVLQKVLTETTGIKKQDVEATQTLVTTAQKTREEGLKGVELIRSGQGPEACRAVRTQEECGKIMSDTVFNGGDLTSFRNFSRYFGMSPAEFDRMIGEMKQSKNFFEEQYKNQEEGAMPFSSVDDNSVWPRPAMPVRRNLAAERERMITQCMRMLGKSRPDCESFINDSGVIGGRPDDMPVPPVKRPPVISPICPMMLTVACGWDEEPNQYRDSNGCEKWMCKKIKKDEDPRIACITRSEGVISQFIADLARRYVKGIPPPVFGKAPEISKAGRIALEACGMTIGNIGVVEESSDVIIKDTGSKITFPINFRGGSIANSWEEARGICTAMSPGSGGSGDDRYASDKIVCVAKLGLQWGGQTSCYVSSDMEARFRKPECAISEADITLMKSCKEISAEGKVKMGASGCSGSITDRTDEWPAVTWGSGGSSMVPKSIAQDATRIAGIKAELTRSCPSTTFYQYLSSDQGIASCPPAGVTPNSKTGTGSPAYSPGSGTGTPGSTNWVNHTWAFITGTQYSSILSRTDSVYADLIAAKDKETRAGYFGGWEDGAGDQLQWQKFGIPKVSATPTTVVGNPGGGASYLDSYRGGLYRLGGSWEACMNRLSNAPDRSLVQNDLRENREPAWGKLTPKGQTDTATCEREAGYTGGYVPPGGGGFSSCPASVLTLLNNDMSCHRMDFSFSDTMAGTYSGAYMASGMSGPYVLIQKNGSPESTAKNCNTAGERISMCTGAVVRPEPSTFNSDADKCWNNGYKYDSVTKVCSYSSSAPPPVSTLTTTADCARWAYFWNATQNKCYSTALEAGLTGQAGVDCTKIAGYPYLYSNSGASYCADSAGKCKQNASDVAFECPKTTPIYTTPSTGGVTNSGPYSATERACMVGKGIPTAVINDMELMRTAPGTAMDSARQGAMAQYGSQVGSCFTVYSSGNTSSACPAGYSWGGSVCMPQSGSGAPTCPSSMYMCNNVCSTSPSCSTYPSGSSGQCEGKFGSGWHQMYSDYDICYSPDMTSCKSYSSGSAATCPASPSGSTYSTSPDAGCKSTYGSASSWNGSKCVGGSAPTASIIDILRQWFSRP